MATAASPKAEEPADDAPKWKLARRGIQLLINNKADEAEALFKKYPGSLQMYAGYSFAVFMDALMTFEDDKLSLATVALKELERRCAADTGWLKTVKSKVFGSDAALSTAQHLESQIMLADSQVCLAILTFLQQDLSGYLKGSWVLRKSWKVYQHAYSEIKNIYKEVVGNLPDAIITRSQSHARMQDSEDLGGTSDSSAEWELPDEPPTFSPTSPSNGYIKNPCSSKLSQSYTTSFDSNQLFYAKSTKCNYKRSCSSSNSSSCGHEHASNSNYDSNCNAASLDSKCCCVDSESRYSNATSPDLDSCSSNNSKRASAGSSASKNCDGGLLSNLRANSAIRKSASVNSALAKHLNNHKRPNGLLSQISPFNSNLSLSYFTSSFNIFSSEKTKYQDIDGETITRLMGAVSFGFGLFHLGISLLPPSLLKITNFFGFGGNRHSGIANLMYARLGTDMRAPLATLSLLWYHTIVRPFYALDGSNVQAGVRAAVELLDESEEEYGESALFLFFKGRVNRLKSDIPEALRAFQASVENSSQREIKLLSLHEVGWCYLIQLDYPSAEHTFQILKLSSRWSRSFYGYLATICAGSCNNLNDFSNLKEMKSLMENGPKGSQLEVFLARRFRCCPVREEDLANVDATFWRVFVYELLYLWNTLASCSTARLEEIVTDCETIAINKINEPMLGLSQLIQGSCYYLLRRFESAIASYRRCLEIRSSKSYNDEDAHVSAFAQYELGTALIKSEETKEEGKTLLNQVALYKDYDFEQRLTHRSDGMQELLEWSYACEPSRLEFYGLLYGCNFALPE